MRWFSHRDRHGDRWNFCHYWSNFEIADLDFFRGEKYQSLYQKLEKDGGFYYERVWLSKFSLVLSEANNSKTLYLLLFRNPFSMLIEREMLIIHVQWGDAAVHSLAVNMLAEPHQVHHFADIGYRHDWYYQCPANKPGGQLPESTTLNGISKSWAPEIDGGVGCRCDCDGRTNRNTASYCHNKLRAPNTIRRPWSTWFLGWIF
jgi:mannosyltransferase